LIEVFFGSGAGGVLRYCIGMVSKKLFDQSWPGTLIVNVIGSILIVLIVQKITISNERISRLVLVGFLGGFTTFSSFSLEIFNKVSQGQYFMAGAIFSLNILLGIVMGILILR
jgi:fluoride exporter